jgi:hypothetical protein
MTSKTFKTFLQEYPTKMLGPEKLQSFLPYEWISSVDMTNLRQGKHTSITLDEDSPEYKKIATPITKILRKGSTECIKVRRIDQLENPFIYVMYLLKKHENYREYISKEINCYHGTKDENVPSILSNNLNWRFFGSRVGHVHGKGVYFSKFVKVSLGYAMPKGAKGCMLLAKVLVASAAPGTNMTSLPPEFYDTTGTNDDQILVKYSDNEFYPEFVAYLE